ncbi:hypothetical protein [Anaerotruncus colihominis]|uniref:hypothetical protein n=1 Tax=Anaerotruncus colihominis TaxID=169435 RepID=UPI0013A611DE|nr:hypothetical protein [Anaerotruncus colihominis]
MTLDDVRITAEMFTPMLSALKDSFFMILPYLLALIGVRLALWLAPVLWRKLNKK